MAALENSSNGMNAPGFQRVPDKPPESFGKSLN